MPIYTRTGDNGTAGLPGGRRVPKNAPIIEACGTLDELMSLIGTAIAFDTTHHLRQPLTLLQEQLFELGIDITAPEGTPLHIAEADTTHLEHLIDIYSEKVPPLRNFILPGGSPCAAMLHLARTVARRYERCLITLAQTSGVNPSILAYSNRISDLLFILARYANYCAGVAESAWHPHT